MAALLFIALSWLFGFILLSRATGGISAWRDSLFTRSKLSEDHTWLFTMLAAMAGSLWIGLIITSWFVYIMAWAADKFLPAASNIHPLLPANAVLFLAWSAVIIRYFVSKKTKLSDHRGSLSGLLKTGKSHLFRHDWPLYLLTGLSLLFFLCFSCWLMLSSFSSNDTVSAGYTVFSDFAPHTAMVSSFSAGRNWPTIYPHFAGDGIAYHFMFFFLCGNLNWLGLPIGLAINIPSILGMVSALILLGTMAVILTKRTAVFLLAPLLTLARSSMAFFTWFADLFHEYDGRLKPIISAMRFQREFIGNTPRDDWGLWTINVYANQRHLMPAFAIMILILLLFLPQLTNRPLKTSLLDSRDWLGYNGKSDRGMLLACLLLFLFAYWHGSGLIATLSILAVMALFSRARLYYLIAAVVAIGGALLQISFFTAAISEGVSARFLWGFIAEDKSLIGLASYLAELTGVLIPLALLMFILPGRRRRLLLAAFLMPLLIAFTVSLTPDVTVNHKFIMITQMMLSIWVADLLVMLWHQGLKFVLVYKARNQQHLLGACKTNLRLLLFRATAVFLTIMLMATGLAEWRIFANANQGSYVIEIDTPVNEWIKQETTADAVFITAPWHYHSFFLTGRGVWLGHSYYAWSAGHDTGRRLLDLQQLLAGEWTRGEIENYARQNSIDYLLIDDDFRLHAQFTINESFIEDNFTLVAAFDDDKHTIIYDLLD